MQSVCVYCGSSAGARPAFVEAAEALGSAIAKNGLRLVYGGGRVGLMGALADAALAAGAQVVGVIPRAMVEREWAHHGLSTLHVVRSMHERKAKMANQAEGFIVLPGGIGTLEEFFEIWTWVQLGLHHKPIGILNVADFFDPLVEMLDRLVAEKFVRPEIRNLLIFQTDPEVLLAKMDDFEPLPIPKWIMAEET